MGGVGLEEAYWDIPGMEVVFDVLDGEFAEVEDGGGEDGVGFTLDKDVGEVLEGTGATGGDDRDTYGLGDSAGDFDIESGFGSVGVDGIEDDFTGSALDGFDGPMDGVAAGMGSAAVREDGPFSGSGAFGIE